MNRKFATITLLTLLIFAAVPVIAVEITSVEAEGYGANVESALQDAQRRAIENAVGVLVGGETLVSHYTLLSDQIVAQSSGFVHSFDVLLTELMADGRTRVIIRADVAPIIDQLVQDRQARDLLLSWLNKPRVEIEIHENLLGDTSESVVAKAVAERLIEAGFTVVDGDAATTISDTVAEQPSAELVLSGESISVVGPTPAVMKRAGMVSVQSSVTASLVQRDNGDVLATHSHRLASPHIDTLQAGRRASVEAATMVVDSLISDVLKVWAMQKANTLPLELVVRGVSVEAKDSVAEQARELPGVRKVFERSYSEGVLVLLLELEGTAALLAPNFDTWIVQDAPVNVVRVSWGQIILERAQ